MLRQELDVAMVRLIFFYLHDEDVQSFIELIHIFIFLFAK